MIFLERPPINKILAVTLPLCWILYIFFHDWEHVWIFRSLCGVNIGYSVVYLWTYNDLRDELLKELKNRNKNEK